MKATWLHLSRTHTAHAFRAEELNEAIAASLCLGASRISPDVDWQPARPEQRRCIRCARRDR
jgi:hypothetical protein